MQRVSGTGWRGGRWIVAAGVRRALDASAVCRELVLFGGGRGALFLVVRVRSYVLETVARGWI